MIDINIKLPIIFDNSVRIVYFNGIEEISAVFPGTGGLVSCSFDSINGIAADHARVTNLVGFNGQFFLKKCPNCQKVKNTFEFGPMGRTTNGQKRDQSHCIVCRKK